MLNSWPHPLPVEDLQRCTQLPLDGLPVVLAELELQGMNKVGHDGKWYKANRS
ncbi:MAG: hypothetical protein GX030_02325 [Firmicutes bacterium]|nr:hypothetical protein [Bacillota bacterium]